MMVTPNTLAQIVGKAVNANMVSVIKGLAAHPVGLDRPVRLARFIGQLAHESGGFAYDHELGSHGYFNRYEGRADLGNTHPGDGYLFRGRGGIQLTGRANYTLFTRWAKKQDSAAPDFTVTPDLLNTDPWEGLAPLFYWDTHTYRGKHINDWADAGDDEAVTRAINGGVNGLAERLRLTAVASAYLCGSASVRAYQGARQLAADGVAGPITRGMLHRDLSALPPVTFALT